MCVCFFFLLIFYFFKGIPCFFACYFSDAWFCCSVMYNNLLKLYFGTILNIFTAFHYIQNFKILIITLKY